MEWKRREIAGGDATAIPSGRSAPRGGLQGYAIPARPCFRDICLSAFFNTPEPYIASRRGGRDFNALVVTDRFRAFDLDQIQGRHV